MAIGRVTGVCPCFLVFFLRYLSSSSFKSPLNAASLSVSLEDGLYRVISGPLGNNSSCECHIDDFSISSCVGLGSTADPQVDLNELRNNREKLLLN